MQRGRKKIIAKEPNFVNFCFHMGLDEEIQQKGKEISTDAYGMSIGELVSLYKNGELDIHPAFQRYFR